MFRKVVLACGAATPVVLLAFSTGPPIKRTGAPVDGGQTCAGCHTTFAPANSDPSGSVTIDAAGYTPGLPQVIHVTVKHPSAKRWGFQLTARLASDPSKQAGTFAPNDLVRVRCDTTPAHDAPCGGALEFPEHNNAPFTSAGAGFTFDVTWTPPATDVGEVVLYAAGNAANGDGTNQGDRIYTTSNTISSSSCNNGTMPSIVSVVDAASFRSTIAPNGLLTIFGSGFASSGVKRGVGTADIANGAFPKSLACVAVEIDGKRAPLVYVQADQVNVQAPATSGLGTVSVKVIANPDLPNALSSASASAQVSATAPALFTLDGKNAAAIDALGNLIADASVAAGAHPAKPGDIVTLFATGLGPTNPPAQAGDVVTSAARTITTVKVTIGGATLQDSEVPYVGLTPSTISGLYQLNVRLPQALPDGSVPVVVQAGGLSSQDGVFIPVKR